MSLRTTISSLSLLCASACASNPPHFAPSARALFQRGQFTEAKQAFAKTLCESPSLDSIEGYLKAELSLGQKPSKNPCPTLPKEFAASYDALSAAAHQDFEGAKSILAKRSKYFEDTKLDLPLLRAKISLAAEDFDEAIQYFSAVQEKHYIDGQLGLIRSYLGQEKPQDAHRRFTALSKHKLSATNRESLSKIYRTLATKPSSAFPEGVQTLLNEAQRDMEAERYNTALWAELHNISEENTCAPCDEMLAIWYLKRGLDTLAIVHAERAHRLAPYHAGLANALAEHLMQDGNYLQAQGWLNEGELRNPFDLDILRGQKRCAENLRDSASLIKLYRRWSRLSPKAADVQLGLAQALRRHGDIEAALLSAEHAFELSPQDVAILVERAALSVAWFEKNPKRPELQKRAALALKDLKKSSPKHPLLPSLRDKLKN